MKLPLTSLGMNFLGALALAISQSETSKVLLRWIQAVGTEKGPSLPMLQPYPGPLPWAVEHATALAFGGWALIFGGTLCQVIDVLLRSGRHRTGAPPPGPS